MDYNAAHKHSFKNEQEVHQSDTCCCFDCGQIFSGKEIKDWITEADEQKTAWCPKCANDTVIGDASGLPVTDLSFIKAMHKILCSEK